MKIGGNLDNAFRQFSCPPPWSSALCPSTYSIASASMGAWKLWQTDRPSDGHEGSKGSVTLPMVNG